MSYLALARKWRPRNFDQVIGQEHVVSALANALDTQRIHHAFLFTGTLALWVYLASWLLMAPQPSWAEWVCDGDRLSVEITRGAVDLTGLAEGIPRNIVSPKTLKTTPKL